jgi:hypothetical protein
MRKLYEIFMILQIQKRIVSTETIRGNTVCTMYKKLTYPCNLALHIYDHNRTDSKCFHLCHRIDLEMLMAWNK